MKVKKILSFLLSVVLLASCCIGSLNSVFASEASSFLSVEGAAIRTTGVQGLKFVGRLYKDTGFELAENAEFGMIIIPQTMVGKNELITVDTESVRIVPAQNLMGETAEYYEFNAVLTDIPAEFYGTEILARAYLCNNGTYYYSAQASRSVKTVADLILADGEATDTDLAVANEVIRQYNLVGNDILVHADSIWYANNQLITYPEYPEQIARDYMYSVSVSQSGSSKDLVVYNQTEAFFYQDRFDGGDVNRRFCEFAFSGAPVTVHVKVNRDFDTYAVVPTSKGFASSYADGVISVTMTKSEQLVIILDDDVNTALCVFADAPETDVPAKGDNGVIYVEGWNQITNHADATLENGILTINGQYTKLYIAPGAVLTARVVTTSDAYAVKIFGRGAILDPASLIYHEGQHGFDVSSSTDSEGSQHLVIIQGYTTTIKDVKLLDSRRFNLNINRGNGTVQNVKILSTIMTSDGITTTAENGTVKDCFVYCGDNALVTQVGSGSKGYSFENITIGTTCSAIYPQYYVNSTFTDIYVFRADEGLVSLKHGNGDNNQKYITINNLDALDCVRTPWLFHAEEQGSAEKIITMNKVLMRYTTGSSNSSGAPGTTTNAKTTFNFAFGAGSNFTLNMTDLYIGGTLITSDSQVKTSALLVSSTKNYYSSGNTPRVLAGNCATANYTYLSKVMLGYRELFLGVKPVQQGDTWYLPYEEIASYLAIAPQNPVTTWIGGVEMISLSNLLASGGVTSANYDSTTGVIKLTPAINSTVNLLRENYLLSSNYNPLYYKNKTAYMEANYESGEWVYTAKSVSSQGGIMRMILDVYQQYGAGTYTVSFDYKASASSITVGIGVDHTEAKYSKSVSGASSTEWKTATVTFTITEDPTSVEQMALWFKVSNGNTISLKNISMTKTN